jgi:hypothetical protein
MVKVVSKAVLEQLVNKVQLEQLVKVDSKAVLVQPVVVD